MTNVSTIAETSVASHSTQPQLQPSSLPAHAISELGGLTSLAHQSLSIILVCLCVLGWTVVFVSLRAWTYQHIGYYNMLGIIIYELLSHESYYNILGVITYELLLHESYCNILVL